MGRKQDTRMVKGMQVCKLLAFKSTRDSCINKAHVDGM